LDSWSPAAPDELSVAFADEESPVYDEYVPGVLLELREHVGALIARFEPRFGWRRGIGLRAGPGKTCPKN
jgi:hypothetical protein